jgi:two-component system, chemotaxis family, protein-glutamate methylesterase/glutaminase
MSQSSSGKTVRRDIIVVGASAGGIEPLIALIARLPAHLEAAVFVVVHTPPDAESRLPLLLARAGELPAAHAEDGEAIVPGRIYVAPTDRHLGVRRGTVEVSRGPRENHSRPAIDPLFRSAARSFGSRTVGVILSGALYDGAAGLLAIKQRGGLAIVQDTSEAMFPSMPQQALALVDADLVLPAAQIGDALATLKPSVPGEEEVDTMVDEEERLKGAIAEDFAEQAGNGRVFEPTIYTCPDCGGVLWQAERQPGTWFRCHVGHAYAPEVLLGQKSEEVEAALWNCVRLMRERATLTRQAVGRYEQVGNEALATLAEEQALADERHADVLRELLEQMPSPVDIPLSAFGAIDSSP